MSDKSKFSSESMYNLIDTINEVREILGTVDKTVSWMITKNPHLGGAEPMSLFLRGRGHKVLQFVRGAVARNYEEPVL